MPQGLSRFSHWRPTHILEAVLCCLWLVACGWSQAVAAEPKGDDCLRCHSKVQYTQKTQHTVPAQGCSGCHVNHETKGEAKLLVSEVPELCYSCHAEKGFKARRQHDPVKQGACLDCHDAHSAEHPGMLINEPIEVCLECHASDLKGKPHVISSSFSGKGHPLGNEPELAKVKNPLRVSEKFYCGSCHDPHKSDYPKLNRFDATSMTGYCQRCHEK